MKQIQTVAIIDDDHIYQFAIKRTIAATNLITNIVTFTDGQQALEFFMDNIDNVDQLPDLVFLDLNMPIVDGWEFLEEYATVSSKINKEILIYVSSSSKNPDDLIQAKSIAEVADYIVKPLTSEKLMSIIDY